MWRPSKEEAFFLDHLPQTLAKFPNSSIEQALHWTQVESKLWALEQIIALDREFKTIYLLAGWYGVLASLIFNSEKFEQVKIRSFDKDPRCAPIAESLHNKWVANNWEFKATTLDIATMKLDPCHYHTLKADGSSQLLVEHPDLIINTSCEHLQNFSRWRNSLPKDMYAVLQSNDNVKEESHINCSSSLASFVKQCDFSEVFYSGTKTFPSFRRFMVVGKI